MLLECLGIVVYLAFCFVAVALGVLPGEKMLSSLPSAEHGPGGDENLGGDNSGGVAPTSLLALLASGMV